MTDPVSVKMWIRRTERKLKGGPTWIRSQLAWKQKMWRCFHLQVRSSCSINISATKHFFLQMRALRGAAISIGSLTNKEQDRVGSWRNVHSCNTWLAWTWCYTLGQNGGAHYRVFAISKRQCYEIEHNFVSFFLLVSVDHLILEDRTRYPLSLDAPLTSRIGDSSQSLAQFI